MARARSSSSPLSISRWAIPSVSIPGPTQLARTPKRPSSTASARTSASTAAFGADDNPSRTGNLVVAAVVTATMLPSASRRCASAGRTTLKNPPDVLAELARHHVRIDHAQVRHRHVRTGGVHQRVQSAVPLDHLIDQPFAGPHVGGLEPVLAHVAAVRRHLVGQSLGRARRSRAR